ncbi:hypothetical protein BGX34_009363 [Mortierella sp. NVP85]|nr:hypothetical protein BGX34_009363 [Mortierella sp. NVP85]
MDLLVNLKCFKSLRLDFGRLSMAANTTCRGFKEVVVTIGKLRNLEHEDFDFIRHCRPIQVKIMATPQGDEEGLLASLLQANPGIAEFRIGCEAERALSVIDLVVSAKSTIRRRGGQCVVKLIDQGAIKLEHLEAVFTIMFSEGSSSFDMDVTLGDYWPYKGWLNNSNVCEIFRRFGWSFRNLTMPDLFSDRHAELLDQATRERDSSIAVFNCCSASLTSSGLDALERVISRSKYPFSATLRVFDLHDKARVEAAIIFLGRFNSRLKGLYLYGKPETRWVLQIVRAFPTRSDFPVLEEFSIGRETPPFTAYIAGVQEEFSNDAHQWIASMVSVPPEPLTRLKSFGLLSIHLLPQDVGALIEAIDLSTLVELRLIETGITQEQLERLIGRITDDSAPALPLTNLYFGTNLCNRANLCNQACTRALWKKLGVKFPMIESLRPDRHL